ncbi:hypothetical protein [Streptomyces sp. SID3343]|uniref:LppU/SCO3897 family protein n=1 Tax=Streptomyces sp. SID3343 TaxID=2690260 RepID=UPI00136F75AD|nr:hypothetical protein [Streptomyces sp. SID3343]MYW06590.1 hypothetical protein [Streptomyces sp. SID3343]
MAQLFGSSGGRVLVGALAVLVAATGLVACDGNGNGTSNTSARSSGPASASATATATASSSVFDTPTTRASETPSETESATPTLRPSRTPSETATPESTKTAYDKGECLSGKINTGGSQEELISVKCSDAAANFKVLRVFPYLMAGRPCDDVSGTDYSYSSYWTRNGIPTYGSTYCLSEIG